ncbi:hypothetical protein [Runella slithyformis]|uniref:Uncharacterized protein n=1 Tax=Runella slithyformis (strain ATCC 29530 / DSM 19594 / LMG 11500 / NCIMB 11436 / LSU 4) TaxID=761193 RepID=A0A7U3ZIU4_RUNSL|nr:hypothetical protein [Runella slithyformis]AEI48020.1 hypothetical protein Runsl_1595 [Runella slithyformis DSM 19594]
MKKSEVVSRWLFLITTLALFSTQALSQTSFQLRLVPKTISCDSVIVSVEIQAPDSAFVMGNANLRIFYKSAQLAAPSIKSRNNFTSGDYSNISSLNDIGTDTSVFTLNVVYRGEFGNGTMVGKSWIPIADIKFSIIGTNAFKCYNLFFLPKNFSNTLPATVITKAYASPTVDDPARTLTAEVNGTFINIANQCSLPVVAIAGDTTIIAGSTATLTLSSQNGVLPATVTITGGASINLTQANPIKTVTVAPAVMTTYQILTVTGTCGAGSAASGKSQAVVQIASPQNDCPPVKCVPITFVIIK